MLQENGRTASVRSAEEVGMEHQENVRAVAPWGLSGADARAVLREHRQQILRYADLPAMPSEESATVASAVEEHALSVDDLPQDLERLIRQYERERPGVRLEPRRYLVVGEAKEGLVTLGGGDLPDDDELVTFAITETTMSCEAVHVRSRVLIAARTPPANAPPEDTPSVS
jgi:hypothetical protein